MRTPYTISILAVTILLFSIFSTGLAWLPESASLPFDRLKVRLDSAVNNADRELLTKVKFGFRSYLVSGNTEIKKLAHYYIGYADYRLGSIFEEIEKDQKQSYINEAIEHLEEATEIAPDFAEGWALLGNCYGIKATGFFSGMKYGPKSEKAIDRALSLSPENPRVLTIYGISLMHKPAIVGGSTQKAIEVFKRAATFYSKPKIQAEIYPDWGHVENYAWLAQAYIRSEQYEEALKTYRKALEINPDYYWVKEVLLPALDKKRH